MGRKNISVGIQLDEREAASDLKCVKAVTGGLQAAAVPVLVPVLLRLCDLLCPGSDSRPQGEQRRGFSIIIDGAESVNEQRCITGTSRCMQGNFSPAPWKEERGRRGRRSKKWLVFKAEIINSADVWTDSCAAWNVITSSSVSVGKLGRWWSWWRLRPPSLTLTETRRRTVLNNVSLTTFYSFCWVKTHFSTKTFRLQSWRRWRWVMSQQRKTPQWHHRWVWPAVKPPFALRRDILQLNEKLYYQRRQ